MNLKEYLLICLAEEGLEVSQAATKATRFGVNDTYHTESPLEAIKRELNDLMGVIELLIENDVEIGNWIDRESIEAKKKKVMKFLEYSKEKGLLK